MLVFYLKATKIEEVSTAFLIDVNGRVPSTPLNTCTIIMTLASYFLAEVKQAMQQPRSQKAAMLFSYHMYMGATGHNIG